MKRIFAILSATVLAAAAFPAAAQTHAHDYATTVKTSGAQDAKADALAEGEVRKVDKAAGKVTIKHGPLLALDMPPMTMVFRAKDPAMLDKVKVGDKIRFKAEKDGGTYTVSEVQPAK